MYKDLKYIYFLPQIRALVCEEHMKMNIVQC